MARYRHNKQNRCGHCYELGHNKRSCPQLTEAYKTRAEAEVRSGDGREGYWHRQYAKRTGTWVDGTPAESLAKQRKGAVRRCKYCNKTGHNTRTCPELAAAKAAYLDGAGRARNALREQFQTIGLGVGALVKLDHYGTPELYMVTGFNPEHMNHETLLHGNHQAIKLQKLTNLSTTSRWDKTRAVGAPQVPAHVLSAFGLEQNNYSSFELAGPVEGGLGELTDAWAGCEDVDIKEVFKERTSPNHYDNQWED